MLGLILITCTMLALLADIALILTNDRQGLKRMLAYHEGLKLRTILLVSVWPLVIFTDYLEPRFDRVVTQHSRTIIFVTLLCVLVFPFLYWGDYGY